MKRISFFTLLLFLCCGLQAGLAQKKQQDNGNRKSEDRRQNDRWDRDDQGDQYNGRRDHDGDRWGREDEDEDDDDDTEGKRGEDYGSRLKAPRKEAGGTEKAEATGKPTDPNASQEDPEQLAESRVSELVAAYGIQDERRQKKLQIACSKYYKAKALLNKDFPEKSHRDRKKREETLEAEYSRELREILPQS